MNRSGPVERERKKTRLGSKKAADWERLPSCRLRSLSKEARYCATARAQVLKQSGREAPHRAAHRRDARAPIVFVSPASPDRMPCRWPAITETAPREREGFTHPTAPQRRWVEKSSTSRPVAQARRNPQPRGKAAPEARPSISRVLAASNTLEIPCLTYPRRKK